MMMMMMIKKYNNLKVISIPKANQLYVYIFKLAHFIHECLFLYCLLLNLLNRTLF